MVLLTGGAGRRFGAPKHLQLHPEGGTWGGHLVQVFRGLFPEGPVQVIGDSVPDWPDLMRFEDPRQGPAPALGEWARQNAVTARRWWVTACDQVRWSETTLRDWFQTAETADPEAQVWVVARHQGHLQPLGGFLSGLLLPQLGQLSSRTLKELLQALPHRILEAEGEEWLDVDSPQDLHGWRSSL